MARPVVQASGRLLEAGGRGVTFGGGPELPVNNARRRRRRGRL